MNEAIPVVDVYNGNNNGGFGGMWGDGLWAIIILAMLGFGNYGGGWGVGGGGYGLNGALTRAELYDGFATQNIDSAVRGVQQGICDSTYALNNTLMSGFHGVDNAICNLGYQTQQGFNTLGYQMKDCCCETQRLVERGFCDLGNTIHNTTRDIIDSQNAGTRAILDFLTNDKIESLRAENQSLRFAASQSAQNAFITANQEAQTAELIRRLRTPEAVPAYVVPNPNCCYGNPLGIGYGQGYNSGNGCGCGC